MIFLHKFPNVMMIVFLLNSPFSAVERVPWVSLWGEVADFTSGCSHWRIKPQVSIPALQEFTVCLSLNLKAQPSSSSSWTIFMYRHPEVQNAELGLGGTSGRLLVWLFGMRWTTPQIHLQQDQWYSLCLTWSHTNTRPALYVNGEPAELTTMAHDTDTSVLSPSRCRLSPNGSLTLGAGHSLIQGEIQITPSSGVLGKISLFRIWGRQRSKEELTSLYCTEGDLLKWEGDHWDTWLCNPVTDSSLQCEWSIYEVRLVFAIIRYDKNETELYIAEDIARRWIRNVLPSSIFVFSVSVFEETSENQRAGSNEPYLTKHSDVFRGSSKYGRFNTSCEDSRKRWALPNISRFQCLLHLNVIPSLDVATVQKEMYIDLTIPYDDPSGLLRLLADTRSIHTTPVESFSAGTVSPPTVVTASSIVSTPTFTTTMLPSSLSPTTNTPNTSMKTSTAFTTTPATVYELYFEVKANVSITGDCDPKEIIPIWLNISLPDSLMAVLDLQLLPKVKRHQRDLKSKYFTSVKVSISGISRESLIFQVQVMSLQSDTQEMEERIRSILLMPYNNGSIAIATQDVQISRILIYDCNSITQLTLKGLFTWPDTSGGKNASCTCPKNPNRSATRHCKLCLDTHWMDPDLTQCHPVVETILDLDHIKVTADNALDVVKMIEDLLKNHSTLVYEEVVTILNKLKDIISVSVVTPDLGQALINIISDILESQSDLVPFTNSILNITEAVGDKMVGYEGSSTLAAPAIAISVVDVVPGEFERLQFGVTSDESGTNPEIFIDRCPFNGMVAFISLPSALQHSFPQPGVNQNPARIQFQFYGSPLLFQSHKEQILNTFVVSASVTNASSPIRDLEEEVEITLHHLKPSQKVQCVYWNFNKNNGHGGWDDYGCRIYNSSSDYTTCLCDHLTHFGALLDVSRTPLDPANEQILTIITYVGCGISSLFLGITLLTYTALEKLRRDYPSQILINLSLALLCLNLVFLVNSWLSSWGVYGLCVAVASTLHYFLLASFTWMGLEAVNMYFALVKVFNVYVPSYILKFCVMGWGVPLVICIVVHIVNREAYGSHLYTDSQSTLYPLDNSDNFCWIQDDVTFYVSVVAYAALISLFNIGVFVVVLIQIRQMRVNSPAGTRRGLLHDLKGVASLTLLLGLTWTVGFFTWGPARIVLLYLFSILNSLQGLFIFLFHCLMKENVRKQWRIHLCFGRFRLEEHSEWSNSASVGAQVKPREIPPRPAIPSVRSVKSSSTDSTSASSDSSQRDSSCRRPNLGFFVNSLALPPAQRDASDAAGLPFYRGMNPSRGWRNHWLDEQEQ